MEQKVALINMEGHEAQKKIIEIDNIIALSNGKQLEIIKAKDNKALGIDGKSQYLVIVLPGGGYEFCSFREARNVAWYFANEGFDSAILHYEVIDEQDALSSGVGLGLKPMITLAHAIEQLRTNKALGFSEHKIVLCGFSAGGHLAASLCTRFDCKELLDAYPWRSSLRPDGAILSYAVQTATENEKANVVFHCLTGSKNPKDWTNFTTDDKVTKNTPPAYIWHTATDEIVPVRNALLYANAMWRCGNKAELLILPQGIHGLSTATKDVEPTNDFAYANEHAALWLKQAVSFVRHYVQLHANPKPKPKPKAVRPCNGPGLGSQAMAWHGYSLCLSRLWGWVDKKSLKKIDSFRLLYVEALSVITYYLSFLQALIKPLVELS